MLAVDATGLELIRCSQKDQQYVEGYTKYLFDILKLCGGTYQYKLANFVRPFGESLYYLFTSLSKYQTLGEEYTGILRLVKKEKNIPSTKRSILWLLLYIGGEDIFLKALDHYEKKIRSNESLRDEARLTLLEICSILRDNKDIFKSLHQALFYINGNYYNISNRLTNIEYVYLRQWLKNEQPTSAFKTLGYLSIFYIILMIIHKIYTYERKNKEGEEISTDDVNLATEDCFICMEKKLNASTLFCGHTFCWKCVFKLIYADGKCPICREVLQHNRMTLLQNY